MRLASCTGISNPRTFSSIATAAGASPTSVSRRPAATSGTPAFAAPEQLLGEQQDAAVDCFSLAAIVAFALSGKPPFGERDGRSILARALHGDLEIDLSAYPSDLADWLRRGL